MLGAVAGLLDLVGQLMALSEKHFTKVKVRLVKNKKINVMNCRKRLKIQSEEEEKEKEEEKEEEEEEEEEEDIKNNRSAINLKAQETI